jgi:hypothetical protein
MWRILQRTVHIIFIIATITGATGCRLHPISLAVSLVGEAVDDRDVQRRKPLLVGQDAAAADAMFGQRHDTLVDDATGSQWLIYREPGESFSESFFVVETGQDGRITGLFKCKRNADGLEDVEKTKHLAAAVYGKTPPECEADARLGAPLYAMHSAATKAAARFYNMPTWTNPEGVRYCVLVFGPRGLCDEVRVIGVTAK